MKRILLSLIAIVMVSASVLAQDSDKKSKTYVTGGGNGSILSFADVEENGEGIHSIPRYTLFFNIGTNYNLDINKNFGIFSGLNIKNIGLITEEDDIKLKRRVYTLGVPFGIKIGNLENDVFFFGGAELDFAFNYKEKLFVNDDKVSKFNEWFSDRTPTLMPSVFGGIQFSKHFSVKAQYYLQNFFNTSYTDDDGMKPYANTDARLFFVSFGYTFDPKWHKK